MTKRHNYDVNEITLTNRHICQLSPVSIPLQVSIPNSAVIFGEVKHNYPMENAIKLENHQMQRIGIYLAPNVPGYNSLFFHPLTKGNKSKILKSWGNELAKICENDSIGYYYFYNDHKFPPMKINVYPNEVIEEWWSNREQK